MTFIITVLIGAGVLFIASSLDNSALVDTFQKIISGSTINWSGGAPINPNVPGVSPIGSGGTCPTGSFPFNGYCIPNGTGSFPAGPHRSCPAGYHYDHATAFCVIDGGSSATK